MKKTLLVAILMGCGAEQAVAPDPTPPVRPTRHYVSTAGTPGGDGTLGQPWDLATALAHPPEVLPGDTIYLEGGTYVGAWESTLRGTADGPIVVRPLPGEHAVLASDNAFPPTLEIGGEYTWYWGFEVTNTDPNALPFGGGSGITVSPSTGIKLIHLIIRDAWSSGIQWSKDAAEGEIYGCISYANGRDAVTFPGKGGYGVYAQSHSGVLIRDNIFGVQGGNYSIHIYGQEADLNDVHLIGNIVEGGGGGRWIVLGGFRAAQRPVVTDNLIHGAGIDIGYANSVTGHGTVDAVIQANVFETGDRWLAIFKAEGDFRFTENTVIGEWQGIIGPDAYPENRWLETQPDTQWVYVRPSAYERGRAHIAVYNWTGAATALIDLTGVLQPGDDFAIYDAFSRSETPLAEGVFAGPVSIPSGGREFLALVAVRGRL